MTRRSLGSTLLALLPVVRAQTPKAKKKARPPAPPRVTAAQREAARDEIEQRMAAAGNTFENPEALDPLIQALSQTQPVHILQFGDSHTASDDWVNSMRVLMQAKYGDGGPGFVQAGRPYRGYRRFDAHGDNSAGWKTEGTMALRGDSNQGLSGISISTVLANQTVKLSAYGETLSLFYLKQPGGGQVEVTVDGQTWEPVSTDGEAGPGAITWPLSLGPHEVSLRTLNHAPVRLYGWALDNKAGLTFETLGINGAQAHVILGWDETLWASQLTARNPALVILAYGTNEANSSLWTREQYRVDMKALIDRVRRAVPQAAVLMIGPPDCGKVRPLLHLTDVIAAQREIAQQKKVAFWDCRKHMGGPGSVKLWVTAGYGQTDYIHMTGDGYRLMGQAIAGGLMEGRSEQTRQDH